MDIPAGNPNIPNPNLQPAEPRPDAIGAAPLERPAAGPAGAEVPAPVPAAPQNSGMPQVPLPAAMPAAPSAPVPSMPAAGAVPAPNMAADVDVIEPEWVEKAEEVVRSHQGDPYGEEEAIEALQEDYLKKRYGFSVAEPDADSTKPGPG